MKDDPHVQVFKIADADEKEPVSKWSGSFPLLLWSYMLLVIIQAVFFVFIPPVILDKVVYLSLHNLIEIMTLVISMLVFVLGWNYYRKHPSHNVVLLSNSFLAIAMLKFSHILSYPDMPSFFTENTPHKSIVFSLGTDFLIAIALLATALVPWKSIRSTRIRYFYVIGSMSYAILISVIGFFLIDRIPLTFEYKTGLTVYKVSAEYILIAIHLLTAVFLLRRYTHLISFDVPKLIMAVMIMLLSRIFLLNYQHVNDSIILMGHIYLMIAFVFIYQAVIKENVLRPFHRLRQSEAALNKSREWLLTTLTSIYDAVITTDVHGKITFMNRSAEALTGWNAIDAFGRDVKEVFPIEGNGDHPVDQVFQSDHYHGYIAELILKNKMGEKIYIQSSATVIKGAGKKVNGGVFVFRDITRRRQTEEKEKRLTAILEATTDFVAIADANHQVLYYNQAARKMLGIDNEELAKIRIADTHPKWAVDIVLNQGLPTAAQHGVWEGESAFLNLSNGNEVPVSQVILSHKNEEGKVDYYSTIARDITEIKKAAVKEKLSAVVIENIDEGVIITDTDQRILSVNPAFTQLTGYQENEVVGEKPSILQSGKHDREFYEAMWTQIEKKGRWQGEIWNRRKNGETFLEEITISRVTSEKGGTTHYVALFKDVTQKRITEELLRKSERLAVVGQLAAGMAHEIRNPLTSIRGFVQLISDQSDQTEPYVKIILSELDRINHIVSELLVLAKPQARNFDQLDLPELVKEVVVLYDTQAIMNNVQIISSLDHAFPPVYGDRNQLKQVFINILKNAIEAMPAGGKVMVDIVKRDESHLVVRLLDEGEGISPEHLDKLGEPFYTTKEKGTGLGLMVSYNIIREHQGEINIASDPGQGTTVEIVLPIDHH